MEKEKKIMHDGTASANTSLDAIVLHTHTFDIYGISLNLEFLYASSPLTKLSSRGIFSSGVSII